MKQLKLNSPYSVGVLIVLIVVVLPLLVIFLFQSSLTENSLAGQAYAQKVLAPDEDPFSSTGIAVQYKDLVVGTCSEIQQGEKKYGIKDDCTAVMHTAGYAEAKRECNLRELNGESTGLVLCDECTYKAMCSCDSGDCLWIREVLPVDASCSCVDLDGVDSGRMEVKDGP